MLLSHTELDLMRTADALQTSHILKAAYPVCLLSPIKRVKVG